VPGWERRADNGNSWLRVPAFFTTGSCALHEISRMTTDLAHLAHDRRVRAALPGLCLAVLTLLFGFGLGIVFGFNEDLIRDRQRAAATAVLATAYQGDAAKVQPVLDKSWAYMQRAHLHAGSLGTSALALSGLVLLLGVSVGLTRAITLALGLGGLGYSSYWLLAGFRAPGMGGTGAAKESLKWLAMPSSGMFVVATALVAVLCLTVLLRSGARARATAAAAAPATSAA
jgi:succinate dehydrogenase hydrophobic anchor subunit